MPVEVVGLPLGFALGIHYARYPIVAVLCAALAVVRCALGLRQLSTRVDRDGIRQRSILGERRIAWNDLRRLRYNAFAMTLWSGDVRIAVTLRQFVNNMAILEYVVLRARAAKVLIDGEESAPARHD